MKRFAALLFILGTITQLAFAGAFDRIGVGSRAKGMGDAFTAVADDASSLYWNPAGLSKLKRKTAMFMYKDMYGLGLVDYSSLIYAQPGFGNGGVAFNWTRLGTSNAITFIKYVEHTFAFAYGMALKKGFKNISIGAGVKYYSVDYETGRASGAGLDLGIRFLKGSFAAAVVGQDVNTPAIWWQTGSKEYIKPNYRFGVAYFGNFATFAADLDQLKSPRSKLHVGMEKWIKKDAFALRAGAFNVTETLWNTTLGATMGITKGYSLDYAYEIHSELGNTHLLTLNAKF